MTARLLQPALTLRDVVGPGHRLLARVSERRTAWLQPDPRFREALAGSAMSTCGEIPYLTSAATATSRVRRLFERAGVAFPGGIETYHDLNDYSGRRSEFTEPGRVVLNHVHADDEIRPELVWIPPALVSYLNNKGNLADLVPPTAVPDRRVVSYASFRDSPPPLPCVVKAATDDSTGGGLDVVLCRTAQDLADALRFFSIESRVVIEEFLEIERSFCLNFAIFSGGEVRYLGAAEQVCTPAGKFAGNWIEGTPLPESALSPAAEAALRAAALGYYGFAGFDVALTPRGAFVIDLNYRYNASTSPLLYLDAIRARFGDVVVRSRRWPIAGRDWEDAVARAIDTGRLVPIYIYDPEGGPFAGQPPFISAAIAGRDRDDVERFLAASGI